MLSNNPDNAIKLDFVLKNYVFWRKKGKVRIITLECTEARAQGATPSRYTTKKNSQTHPERLEKKKYNPFLRKHTVHKEIK